jgi:hypothetical protein
MKKLLAYFISEDLNLDYFWDLSVNETRIRLLGYHSAEVEAYLLSKGFAKVNYLYKDEDDMVEYQLENLYATLVVQN